MLKRVVAIHKNIICIAHAYAEKSKILNIARNVNFNRYSSGFPRTFITKSFGRNI